MISDHKNKSWYVDWFNSHYYHILYRDRDDYEARVFIDNLIRLLNIPPHSKILDLACGKGRHAVYMNQKGFDVTGLDLSAKSIAHALRFENPKMEFFVHDMRQPFRINYYDYVFNLFSSFGYFEKEKDNFDTIKYAVKALKKNGILVLDFMNSNFVISNLIEEEVKTIDNIDFKIKRFIENDFIIKQIDFTDNGKNFSFREKVKALALKDFENYFHSAGLKIIHLLGDYQLNIFDKNNSERLILIAKK